MLAYLISDIVPLSGYALLGGNDANEVKAKTIKVQKLHVSTSPKSILSENFLPDSNKIKKIAKQYLHNRK